MTPPTPENDRTVATEEERPVGPIVDGVDVLTADTIVPRETPTPPNPVLGGGGQAPIDPNAGDFIRPGEARVPYGLPSNPT